jgi:hypothetical protein
MRHSHCFKLPLVEVYDSWCALILVEDTSSAIHGKVQWATTKGAQRLKPRSRGGGEGGGEEEGGRRVDCRCVIAWTVSRVAQARRGLRCRATGWGMSTLVILLLGEEVEVVWRKGMRRRGRAEGLEG